MADGEQLLSDDPTIVDVEERKPDVGRIHHKPLPQGDRRHPSAGKWHSMKSITNYVKKRRDARKKFKAARKRNRK